MQTRVLKLKLRTPNRDKANRLAHMQHAFTDAVRMHLDAACNLPKPSVSSLHAACYQQARQRFALPASTVQQARDKALSIYRSVQARRRKKRKTSQPKLRRLLPLRLAVENLRVFPDRNMARISTPDGFLWLPVILPDLCRTLSTCPMPSPKSSSAAKTGTCCSPSRLRMFRVRTARTSTRRRPRKPRCALRTWRRQVL